MTNIQYEIDINAPVDRVYEYYTNPDNIKQAWPQDIVKESESLSGSKNEEGSEMKVTGEYMGKRDEMILEVTEKEQIQKLRQNRRGSTGVLFLTQPEDKIEAPESQDKELWNGVGEEYKKMKDELLKERIELGHHRLEFRQRYLSSANEEIQEFECIIVVLGCIIPVVCTFNLSTVKYSLIVDKFRLENINKTYKIKNQF